MSLPEISAPPDSPMSDYMNDVLEPVTLFCAGAVAFWAEEKKWPDSVEDVAALPRAYAKWLNLLSRFSDVGTSEAVALEEGLDVWIGADDVAEELQRIAIQTIGCSRVASD
jgi:hypothetical protein